MNYIVVLCTVPDKEVALHIASTLVSQKIAACVNIVPGITSLYSWKGEICNDQELMLIIKAKKNNFSDLELAIKKMHPYEVPEIIALSVIDGANNYLQWIDEVTD